jgi:exopolysaccharide biosynthesis polyprenyl glycosylphosphotransferase
MASSTTSVNARFGYSKSELDLRAPLLAQLRKGIAVRWLRIITLIIFDAAALYLAWQIAGTYVTSVNYLENSQYNRLLLPIVAIEIGLIATLGFYTSGQKRCDYFSLIKTLAFSHVLLFVSFSSQSTNLILFSAFIPSLFLSIFLTCFVRFGVDAAVKYVRQQGLVCYPTFLICRPEDKEKAVDIISIEKCYNFLGWANVNLLATERDNLDATLEDIYRLGIAEVFVCSWSTINRRMLLYWKLRNAGITLHILPVDLEIIDRKSELRMLCGLPTFKFSPPLITGSDFWVKRCFDFCFATTFAIVAAPLYLCIALLIKLDSPGPVFYKQTRIGLHGRPFEVWKFRTMVTNADQLQKDLEASNEMKDGVLFKIKNDPRITPIGKFLRHYSLDELPQLFNVILGEMSLVGPRPLPIRDVEKFSQQHFIRHEVLPGVTGLWQVSGRSNITDFEEVVGLDVSYIKSWSLWLDLRILLQTVAVVLGKKGAY